MQEKTSNWALPYLLILAIIVLLRVATLTVPDLMDTTEGRYATTSQIMLERNDWVTPWIIFQGVEKPYLGKPPLHFWLINASFEVFGLANFAARLPGVLSSAAIALTLFDLTAQLLGRRAALISVLVFSTSLLTFVSSGLCLIDVTLTFGITLAIAGFAIADRSRSAGYLCFLGLALGVLTKGPVAIVFFGMAVGPWIAVRWWLDRSIPTQMRAMPWLTGTLLFIVTAMPWYVLSESRNPGFLEYFIWVENIGRFTTTNYGDQYGSGRVRLLGTAWAMLVPSLMPWSLALIGTLRHQLHHLSWASVTAALRTDEWLLLGLLWTVSCPVLLIFAKQYTLTYNMSSIPGFAFLVAVLWKRATEATEPYQLFSPLTTRILVLAMSLAVLGASVVFYVKAPEPSNSQTIFGIVTGLGLLVAAFRLPSLQGSMSSIGAVALISAIGYSAILVAADAYLSTHRSTRTVLAYAASLVPGEHLNIGFANNLPFSARFYSSLMRKPTVKVSQISIDRLPRATEDLIILRLTTPNSDVLAKDPSKVSIGEIGRWRVYRHKQP